MKHILPSVQSSHAERPLGRSPLIWIAAAICFATAASLSPAQDMQEWKVAYRLAPNEYDRAKFDDPNGNWDHVVTAFSPDGETIAAGYGNGLVRLYNTADGTLLRVLEGHQKPLILLQFSRDGRRLLSTAKFGECRLWNPADGRLIARIHQLPPGTGSNDGDQPMAYRVYVARLSGDGNAILTLGKPPKNEPQRNQALLWREDASGQFSPTVLLELNPEQGVGILRDATFSPNDKSVAIIAMDGGIHNFDIAAGRITRRTNAESKVLFAVRTDQPANVSDNGFSPDGKRFGVLTLLAQSALGQSSRHGGVMTLDADAWGQLSRWTNTAGAECLAWSPDSRRLAITVPGGFTDNPPIVLDSDRCDVVVEMEDPRPRFPQENPPPTRPTALEIYSVVYSSDGKYLLGGRPIPFQMFHVGDSQRPKYDYIWDAETGTTVARLEGDPEGMKPQFSADGKRIVNWSPRPAVWQRVK